MAECPDLTTWEGLLSGALETADAAQLALHLTSCATCRSAYQGLCGHQRLIAPLREALLEAAEQTGGGMPTAPRAASRSSRSSTEDGRMIGPYRLVREISAGGMGVVHLAMRDDDRFRRQVAVKVLKRGMDSEELLRRFELE
ncbi:MAG: hypothetical protein ACYTGC_05030, partial [Planctomycetota bacterium]